MSTLAEVSESRERLAHQAHNPRGTRSYTRGKEQFARASLRELGFREPPTWTEVLELTGIIGHICEPDDVRFIQSRLTEADDSVRPVMAPVGGIISICHGSGVLAFSVVPPRNVVSLDTNVVYKKNV